MWYRWNELQKNLKRDKIHCCVRIVQKARQDELSWRQQLALYFTKTYCHGDIFLDFFVGKLINVKAVGIAATTRKTLKSFQFHKAYWPKNYGK